MRSGRRAFGAGLVILLGLSIVLAELFGGATARWDPAAGSARAERPRDDADLDVAGTDAALATLPDAYSEDRGRIAAPDATTDSPGHGEVAADPFPTIGDEFWVEGLTLSELDVDALDAERADALFRSVSRKVAGEFAARIASIDLERCVAYGADEYRALTDVVSDRFFWSEGEGSGRVYRDVTGHLSPRFTELRRLQLRLLENPAWRDARQGELSTTFAASRSPYAGLEVDVRWDRHGTTLQLRLADGTLAAQAVSAVTGLPL